MFPLLGVGSRVHEYADVWRLQVVDMNEPKDRKPTGSGDARDRIDAAAQDWFLLMTSGDPTEDDHAFFNAWLAADPRHQAVYDELSALWDGIGDLNEAFVGADTRPAAHHPYASRRNPVLWGGLAAACVAVLFLVSPNLAVQITADHRAGVGEQTRIELPDGSIAWLNTDTAISVDYRTESRRIGLLRGEALFDVAKDAGRPFSVMAHNGRSTALGTVFAVRDDGAGVVVTVSEGTVEVASPLTGGETVILRARDQVRYREGAAPSAVHRVAFPAATQWREGFIAIEGLPLDDAISEIDRYRPGRIVLLADADRLDKVTARLAISSIDDGLDALAATHGLSVTRLTDYLVIVR